MTVAENRFWAKVRKGDDCWEWTGRPYSTGYGMAWVGNRRILAHRYAYQAEVGPIPDGLFVCHRCDNRLCVRPDHLFLGTLQDNHADMVAKGRIAKGDQNGMRRHPEKARRGEAHGMAVLNEAMVRTIRQEHMGGKEPSQIARNLGVNRGAVRDVLRGKTWAWLK